MNLTQTNIIVWIIQLSLIYVLWFLISPPLIKKDVVNYSVRRFSIMSITLSATIQPSTSRGRRSTVTNEIRHAKPVSVGIRSGTHPTLQQRGPRGLYAYHVCYRVNAGRGWGEWKNK